MSRKLHDQLPHYRKSGIGINGVKNIGKLHGRVFFSITMYRDVVSLSMKPITHVNGSAGRAIQFSRAVG